MVFTAITFPLRGLQSDTKSLFFPSCRKAAFAPSIHLRVPSGCGGNMEEPNKQDPRSDYFAPPSPHMLELSLISLSLPSFFLAPISVFTSHQTPPSNPPTRLFPCSPACDPAPAVPWEKLTAVSPENLCECRPGRGEGGWAGRKASSSAHLPRSRKFSS